MPYATKVVEGTVKLLFLGAELTHLLMVAGLEIFPVKSCDRVCRLSVLLCGVFVVVGWLLSFDFDVASLARGGLRYAFDGEFGGLT